MRERFPSLNIIEKQPKLTLDEQVNLYGNKLWESNPNLCCKIRKILPLEESLANEKSVDIRVGEENNQKRVSIQSL